MCHTAIVNKRVPILFLANKMDLDGSMTPTEATHVLGLEAIKEQSWYICATNALTGEGLPNGMDWLADAITKLP